MKSFFTENMAMKISAVLISVFLWFFVTSRGQSEISLDVPVDMKNIPAGMEVVHSSTKTVNVTIRGQERLLKNVRVGSLRVFVDLSKGKKGEGTFYVDKEDIKLPYAMKVVNVMPSTVKVRLEETVRKETAVRPVLLGSPDRGFQVVSVSVEPRTVRIEGLASEVGRVGALKTEPFDISGARGEVVRELKIDTGGANVRLDVNTVTARIVVEKR